MKFVGLGHGIKVSSTIAVAPVFGACSLDLLLSESDGSHEFQHTRGTFTNSNCFWVGIIIPGAIASISRSPSSFYFGQPRTYRRLQDGYGWTFQYRTTGVLLKA